VTKLSTQTWAASRAGRKCVRWWLRGWRRVLDLTRRAWLLQGLGFWLLEPRISVGGVPRAAAGCRRAEVGGASLVHRGGCLARCAGAGLASNSGPCSSSNGSATAPLNARTPFPGSPSMGVPTQL
jgi:hypothetical protein